MALNEHELSVLKANNEFTKDLYKVLSKSEQGNLFFSPLSAHAVLSMAHHAADGKTKEAFASTLHITDENISAEGYNNLMNYVKTVKDVVLLIANKAFVSKGFELRSSFKEVAVQKFHSEVDPVDFTQQTLAAATVNNWVKEKTKEKIKELFEEADITPDTAVILVNAIYFKGNWAKKFQRDRTTTEPFFVTENEQIDCQMMHVTARCLYKEDKNLKAKVLMMPYTEKDFGMVVILPKKKHQLAHVEEKIAEMDLNEILKDTNESNIDVSLPKFKFEQKFDMKDTLTELGLGEIFEGSPNFSRMLTASVPLKVKKVIQKTYVEVNEEGAEAAGATGIRVTRRCAVRRPKFYANHPFIILIGVFTENISKIFFCGKIEKPVSGDSHVGPRAEPNDQEWRREREDED